jgi:acetyl esterase
MPEHYVRPDVRAYLDALEAKPRPPLTDALIAFIRGLPPGALPSQDLPVGELETNRTLAMPGPGGAGAGAIKLRMFDARAERGPSPVVIFYHGGGFAVGSIDTHAALAAEIARHLDLPVVSVEYRLAPEYPFPAAPDDAEAAARWIVTNGAAFERTFTGIILCGDSAGGTLAAVTSLALRDHPAAQPVVLQLLMYPRTDFATVFDSQRFFDQGYALSRADMAYCDQAYRCEVENWRASPARADQRGLPPTLIATAALDPLRDDGRAYAARTIAAGVPTTFREFEGTIHGFATYRAQIPSARRDLAAILDAAASMLREPSRR